ncbi:uncharacterized protein EV420DRAFT_1501142 [Desarmillaria tabescens]|uniref:Nucleolar protein 58 n=1 Tax=Armillaria tabescens TaxID=1929756 RepID=A0AA39NLA8_ARMTA|nr:uncharacterized protein EV420DRAFT_1501142 [Desarmillaria tabescens]KAK0467748.1 hypothetical protein EV420DRAFT_1501142 [Desarmillaria tabescens]
MTFSASTPCNPSSSPPIEPNSQNVSGTAWMLFTVLIWAHLLSHRELMSLAKQPASTVQNLGAKKAFFRALNNKPNMPCASHQPGALEIKLQTARMVATKAAFSIRLDVLVDSDGKSEPKVLSIGLARWVKLESRLRAMQYEDGATSVRRFARKWENSSSGTLICRDRRRHITPRLMIRISCRRSGGIRWRLLPKPFRMWQ